MKPWISHFSKICLFSSGALLFGVQDAGSRIITVEQVKKGLPDEALLDRDYLVSENDSTVDISIQRWQDNSPEWMHDGCVNLQESDEDWLLNKVTYNPAKVNPQHPFFLAKILVYSGHLCKGSPLSLQLGDFTYDSSSEPNSPVFKPWEDPRNEGLQEGYQNIAGLNDKSNTAQNSLNFHLEIPDVLPGKDVPDNLRTPLREDYADDDAYEKEVAIRWHQASAWRGSQHIADISAGMKIEIEEEAEQEIKGDKPKNMVEELGQGYRNDNGWWDQVGVFSKDGLGGYGYWGPVSLKFISDYSHWYGTEYLQRNGFS